eukprot:c19385_g1_i1.p1 GENE.c19385_g1_i1~~c19385_g1_i1.p1  ORF type:complete len:389 (-),score=92.96 c19385_g1_i1:26-1192(-)
MNDIADEDQPLLIEKSTNRSVIDISGNFLTSSQDSHSHSYVQAVFVVNFHVKHANTLEWQHPNDINLLSIEFKSLPSGLHDVESDFVYFKLNDSYCVACFNRLKTNDKAERNAKMCSIGIMMNNYEGLVQHLEFLSVESRRFNRGEFDKTRLLQFFSEFSHPKTDSQISFHSTFRPFSTSFIEFIQYFGPSVFTIWKSILLKQRILLFNKAPISSLSNRSGWCKGLISNHVWNKLGSETCASLFHVSIAEHDFISKSSSYIACTTDRIYSEKESLWDIFFEGNKFKTSKKVKYLNPTRGDKLRFNKLWKEINNVSSDRRDSHAIKYFENLTNNIWEKLIENYEEKQFQSKLYVYQLSNVGFHWSDFNFVRRMINLYETPIKLRYCPCC